MANQKCFSTAPVVTVPFRLAFPELFKPVAYDEGKKPKYSITMLFPKEGKLIEGHPEMYNDPLADLTGLRKLLLTAIRGQWGEDKAKWPANFRAVDLKTYTSPTGKDGWPVRDGDLVDWDGYAENWYIRASSLIRPGLVDRLKQPVLTEDQVYGGLICRALVNAFAYPDPKNPGVSLGLSSLQILRDDGTIFGGQSANTELFDSFGDSGSSSAASDEDNW